MREKIAKALDYISDAHIAEAAEAKQKRRLYWIGAVAAVLALVILITAIGGPTTAQATGLIAAPEYPQMAAYSEDWNAAYEEWWDSQESQYDQPAGYGDNLSSFFAASIPAMLASEGKNEICSPLNIYMALSMLAEVTDGTSRQQILDLLNADSIASLRTQAGYVWNAHYCADGATASVLANSLWLNDGLHYNKDTVQTLAEDYYASVYQGVLGSGKMNEALQSWLNEQTGRLLEAQVQDMELSSRTVLALVSTVYYRAKWQRVFLEQHNTEGIFHAPGGDVDVTYMSQTLDYGPYCWGTDYAATYLNLEDRSRMWLILPDEGKTPADVLASGEALDLVLNGSENQKEVRVNLRVPKFDVVSDRDAKEALQSLGVTAVFDPGASDFSPILPETTAWMDRVQHTARVAIDEEGVEAAAYTVLQAPGAGAPPADEVDLVLNRPFIFIITSKDNLPLFAGVVNEP